MNLMFTTIFAETDDFSFFMLAMSARCNIIDIISKCITSNGCFNVCMCLCWTGSMIDRITVFCGSALELQEWLEHLQPFTKGGSPAGTILKVTQTHSLFT